MSEIRTECNTNGYYPDVKGKMRKMALYITSPEFDGNIKAACEKIGVARSTFYRWQQDSNYREFVNWLIEEYTDSELSNMWRAVIKSAKKGDPRAQKLYFELKDLYKPVTKVENSGAVVVIRGEEDV